VFDEQQHLCLVRVARTAAFAVAFVSF
jgi:hypothetical protein